MAFAPLSDIDLKLARGGFNEAEHGNHFEYSAPRAGEFVPFAGYDLKVYVGPHGVSSDQGFRWAKVTATRAYLVTDEDAEGAPVVERWVIRNHRVYEAR